ncbi:uncharacterized protein LOC123316746 [Coccinella septempunctata]|uniref:uncharacterized protein LOC123316746 n=1 Tax=Coccinella septempunctata TaxID=41139 RepID=UPI001D080370|nr:uncharacterized protein LOC123316746 [Coccinella septempunctata]
MKYFNVLGFFFLVYILVVVYSGACLPEEEGLSKHLECNRCRCRRGNWLCTKKGCVSNFFKRELPIAADLRNIPCAPNDYFQIDCNTCYCNLEQSGYLCTENICTGEDHSIGGPTTQIPLANSSILLIANNTAQIINKASDIEDNSTFALPKIDITALRDTSRRHPKIFRSNSFKGVASSNATDVKKTNSSRRLNTRMKELFSCTPGQMFKKDCNDCKCTQDGKNAICTTKNCSAEPILLSPASSTATSLLIPEESSAVPAESTTHPSSPSPTTPGNMSSVANL